MSTRPPGNWSDYNDLDGGPVGRARMPRSNRTCPVCEQNAFVVARSLTLPDGSTWRERHCRQCGHIEERIVPPERAIDG